MLSANVAAACRRRWHESQSGKGIPWAVAAAFTVRRPETRLDPNKNVRNTKRPPTGGRFHSQGHSLSHQSGYVSKSTHVRSCLDEGSGGFVTAFSVGVGVRWGLSLSLICGNKNEASALCLFLIEPRLIRLTPPSATAFNAVSRDVPARHIVLHCNPEQSIPPSFISPFKPASSSYY